MHAVKVIYENVSNYCAELVTMRYCATEKICKNSLQLSRWRNINMDMISGIAMKFNRSRRGLKSLSVDFERYRLTDQTVRVSVQRGRRDGGRGRIGEFSKFDHDRKAFRRCRFGHLLFFFFLFHFARSLEQLIKNRVDRNDKNLL